MSVLIVAAHPDDEVLGCGGTIARLAAEGEDVSICILGEGSTSRAETRDVADEREVDALGQQCREAAKVLGARAVELHGLPDNRFDSVALLDVVKLVEAAVERAQPRTVLCQHGGDLNVDHQRTFAAVLAATRPVPGCVVREVLSFEVGSSSEWAFNSFAPGFLPSTFVDISTTLDQKLEAMDVYSSEMRDFPHPRSREALTAQARKWGATTGVHAAEAFYTVRTLR